MEVAQPPSANLTPLIIVAIVLILLSMLFSASESAYLSVNKLRIRFLRSKKHKGAIRTGKLLDNKEKLLNTILVANNIVNISLTSLITTIAYQLYGNSGVALATGIALLILLIFGEITPKTIGTRHAETIAFHVAWLFQILERILQPFVFIFTTISRFLASLFKIQLKRSKQSFSEEDIKTFLEVGNEAGVLEKTETRMMHRVFKFTDLEAKDIMIPRTEIIFISANANYREVIELSQKSRFSRFPVVGKDNNIDDIQGVLYIKDVLFYRGDQKDFSVKKVMRPSLFILETKKMSSIQEILRKKSHTIAIILDEYSGTSGLLTKEDITREIFGFMGDEFDTFTPNQKNTHIKPQNGMIDGNTRLIDIADSLSIPIASEYYETIAGYIMEKTDHIPSVGDSVTVQNWTFTVSSIQNRRIKEVYIEEVTE
ncbi:MAG: hypothetical protein BKP49_07905 [Treponema sp. CETP13]|nr:MAG: hypothetical protein BKP49_07905 [Treponema sp. CETP13]